MTTVVVRADGSRDIGTGHIMRCLALVEALSERQARSIFVTASGHPWILREIERYTREVEVLDGRDGKRDHERTHAIAAKTSADWIVLDGYSFSPAYREHLQRGAARLLCIDDQGKEPYSCDVVVNGNIYARELNIHVAPATQVYAGPAYALLRREFRHPGGTPPRDASPRVLVTMGGADPDRAVLNVLRALSRMSAPVGEVRVVIGGLDQDEGVPEAAATVNGRVEILRAVDNMAGQMQWADRCITAAGSTVLEYCRMGVAVAAGSVAENQVAVAEGVVREGVGINLGWLAREPAGVLAASLDAWFEDVALREQQASRGPALVDGLGAERVVGLMVPGGATV